MLEIRVGVAGPETWLGVAMKKSLSCLYLGPSLPPMSPEEQDMATPASSLEQAESQVRLWEEETS